jgi:hypothetical protein
MPNEIISFAEIFKFFIVVIPFQIGGSSFICNQKTQKAAKPYTARRLRLLYHLGSVYSIA